MLRENKNFTGNDRFEGFCIDLLRRIASQIGFQYTIRLVPDHMYGVYDRQTKQWNGIVRELMERVSRIRLVYVLPVPPCLGRLGVESVIRKRREKGSAWVDRRPCRRSQLLAVFL